MTINDIKKFYEEQIEWHKDQVEWCSEQIEWYTKWLKRSREEDREFVEWVNQNPNYSEIEKASFANYKSSDTKENEKYRHEYYARRKHHRQSVASYERMLAEL